MVSFPGPGADTTASSYVPPEGASVPSEGASGQKALRVGRSLPYQRSIRRAAIEMP